MGLTLHPTKPPLATIGRVLTLIQVICYLPLILDVGGTDAFLALSAALASYYWALSTLRLVTRRTRFKWIGDTFAVFQFLVVPSCLAICWAVYCPPEKNSFLFRWIKGTNHVGAAGLGSLLGQRAVQGGKDAIGAAFSNSTKASLVGLVEGSTPPSPPPSSPPPHIAATDASDPTSLTCANKHPYLEGLFDTSSQCFLYLARKVPGWWGTLLRLSSPAFSLLEGSATLLVIQVLGTGCRYIIATSLSLPASESKSKRHRSHRSQPFSSSSSTAETSEDEKNSAETQSPSSIWRLFSTIGIRGAEAWQLFFLITSSVIYVVSGWALFLSFDGVAARGGGAALMMGVSVASVAWLTAIAFAIGKGNVIETALIFAYTSWNIFALSSAASLSFVTDPLALVRSFKSQVTSTYLDHLARILTSPGGVLSEGMRSFLVDSLELVKVTFGQGAAFLGALVSALPASVVVSLVYRLMVLYAASRILPLLLGPSAAARNKQNRWASSSSSSSSSSRRGSSSMSSSRRRRREGSSPTGASSSNNSSSSSGSSNSSRSSSSGSASDSDLDHDHLPHHTRTSSSSSSSSSSTSTSTRSSISRDSVSEWTSRTSTSGSGSSVWSSDDAGDADESEDVSRGKKPEKDDDGGKPNSNGLSPPPFPSSSSRRSRRRSHHSTSDRRHSNGGLKGKTTPSSTSRYDDSDLDPLPSFLSLIISYARLILIAVYSHLLLLDQSHQAIWRFSTVSVTLGLWTMELVLGGSGGEYEVMEWAAASAARRSGWSARSSSSASSSSKSTGPSSRSRNHRQKGKEKEKEKDEKREASKSTI